MAVFLSRQISGESRAFFVKLEYRFWASAGSDSSISGKSVGPFVQRRFTKLNRLTESQQSCTS